jgi:predicted dinucleotide-binding enzyme
MKVGVLGSGSVGKVLGTAFATLRHDVMLGSREPERDDVKEWRTKAGGTAKSGSFSDAAKFGDLVVLATAWSGTQNAIQLAGTENMRGKVVIDTTNPLDFSAGQGKPPRLAVSGQTSAGEQVQQWLPQSRVVKAFNHVGNAHMFRPEFPGGPPDMFICGNDATAKKEVGQVLGAFGWPDPIDLGGMEAARYIEPLAMIWILDYFRTGSGAHAFKLLRK